jgi:hypothetical protein
VNLPRRAQNSGKLNEGMGLGFKKHKSTSLLDRLCWTSIVESAGPSGPLPAAIGNPFDPSLSAFSPIN